MAVGPIATTQGGGMAVPPPYCRLETPRTAAGPPRPREGWSGRKYRNRASIYAQRRHATAETVKRRLRNRVNERAPKLRSAYFAIVIVSLGMALDNKEDKSTPTESNANTHIIAISPIRRALSMDVLPRWSKIIYESLRRGISRASRKAILPAVNKC